MERTDAERREDSLQQALGSAERMNIQRAAKITELERVIAEARQGAFGFIIKDEETLLQGMTRNYAEFDDERTRLYKENDNLRAKLDQQIDQQKNDFAANKIRLKNILTLIDTLRTNNSEALEQIWNNMKLVKIQFC